MAINKSLYSYMFDAMGSEHINTIQAITQIMNQFSYSPMYNSDKLYLFGGAVRDLMSGNIPKDFDFATSAPPSKIERVLKTRKYGRAKVIKIRNYFKLFNDDGELIGEITEDNLYKQFKNLDSYELQSVKPMVVAELYDETTNKIWNLEIASYHIYLNPIIAPNGEITTRCLMVKTIEEHLSNLDFTVNSIAMTADGKILDLFQGVDDIKTKTLKAIFPTKERFEEQPRTMLRAIKLLVSSGYKLDSITKKALVDAKFEIDNKMRPSMKGRLMAEILTYPGGIQLLNKYGISSKIWKDFGSVLNVGSMSNMNKGFNTLIRYLRAASESKIDISKESAIILLYYYISKSFGELTDESIIKTAKKNKLNPKISKVINKYGIFNNNTQLIKEYVYFFRAIDIYLGAKTYSDIYKVKMELDKLISESMMLPNTLLKCFNVVVTIIALDNKKELPKIKQTNKFLYALYSSDYQKLLKNKEKATKHLYSYYDISQERAEEIIEDLIIATLIDKDMPQNWEYILTKGISHKKYKLSFRGDIKYLVGVIEDPINYLSKMEPSIHTFVAKDKTKNIEDGFVSDSMVIADWHSNFLEDAEDLEEDDQKNVLFYRKLLNLLMFQWHYKITPPDKEKNMRLWINEWFSYTLDAMLFNDSGFISGNRDIKNYKQEIIKNLNDTEIKDFEAIQTLYNEYMYYGYELWDEGNTSALNKNLNEARKITMNLFKDNEAYTSFFQDNIIIDDDAKKLSELTKSYNHPLNVDNICPYCGGPVIVYSPGEDMDDSARCVNTGCYKEVSLKEPLNFREIDWFIFNDNNYIHAPVSLDIYKRLQSSLNKEERKTIRASKKEYNEFMFSCHKEFCKLFNIIDIDDSDYYEMLPLSKTIYTLRRKMMDLNIKRMRGELLKRGVFKEENFTERLSIEDAIVEYSFIFDWILYNTEDSYKLTKIDFIRALVGSYLKSTDKRDKFLSIQKDYYDTVQNNRKRKDLYGIHYNDISLIYYKALNEIKGGSDFKDSKIWKTNRPILKFLNNNLWFDEYFIGNIIPIYYPKRNWFDLVKTIEHSSEKDLSINNELSTCIYSILQIYNPKSWGQVASIYNQIPIENMEFGFLTANMAQYIYKRCIKPYEKKK
jgi:hypothetical protein